MTAEGLSLGGFKRKNMVNKELEAKKAAMKAELMERCQSLRAEFPKETAFYVYAMMICCRFDKDKARERIKNHDPIKVYD